VNGVAGTQVIKGEVPAGAFEADVKDVVFERARAREIDFSRRVFATFTAERSVFERCDFQSATIRYGPLGLGGTIFRDCRFDRADLRGVDPGEARFEQCIFNDAKIVVVEERDKIIGVITKIDLIEYLAERRGSVV